MSRGISKFITDEMLTSLNALKEEDTHDGTWFFCADEKHDRAHLYADILRRTLGEKLGIIRDEYSFVWIDGFPLLEWDEGCWTLFCQTPPFYGPL